jgi:hypothetical protein
MRKTLPARAGERSSYRSGLHRLSSFASRDSQFSFGSLRSFGSLGSAFIILSALSAGSILSIGSRGSILSIGGVRAHPPGAAT